jgi:acetyl-CoA carboxylase carboxyltransferase component
MASSLGTDDVIDPRELRNKLLQALDLARERIRNPRSEREHSQPNWSER